MNVTTEMKENRNPIENSKTAIKEQLSSFEAQIKSYNGKDPLELWLNYITYVKQLNTDERKECGVKIHYLYQRCISMCQPCSYHNNERFVTLFMEYSKNYETKPLEKFEWMFKHKYGLKQADFFIEWAMLFEKKGDFEDAIQTIELGLKQSSLSTNPKLNNYYRSLKPEPAAQLEPTKIEDKKFAFNYNLLYQSNGQEFSFEEIKALIYYKTCQKYIDEINELKLKLEQANIEITNNKSKRSNRESTMFQSTKINENLDLTEVTNQTSMWQRTERNEDDMDEDDEEENDNVTRVIFDEEKPSDRSMPPPPPPVNELSTLNETNVVLTLAGAGTSFINSYHQANYSNCSKVFEDKQRISRMFHYSAADLTTNTSNTTLCTTRATESIVIFQDKQDEKTKVKEFSIHSDSVSQDPAANIENQKYNEEGSLFYYKTTSTEGSIRREPLKLLLDTETTISSSTQSDSTRLEGSREGGKNGTPSTILFETNKSAIIQPDSSQLMKPIDSNDASKLDDFEPPASSTCFIRPILKTNKKKDEFKEVENEINWNKGEDTFNCGPIIDKDLEKEKLLEFHLNANSQTDPEMNMSKLISEDCMTQATKWSNCITKFKNKQSVRFNENSSQKLQDKFLNETSLQTKSLNQFGHEISWDNESFIGLGDEKNDTEFEINFSLIKSELKINENIQKTNNEFIDDENELLTSEKLDQTFQKDYMRLYYEFSVKTPDQTFLSKIVDDQIKAFDLNETRQHQLTERTILGFSQLAPTKSIPIGESLIENQDIAITITEASILEPIPTTVQSNGTHSTHHNSIQISEANRLEPIPTSLANLSKNFEKSKLVIDKPDDLINSMIDQTYNENVSIIDGASVNGNETIIQAIRDPFGFDIKIRLLERGPNDKLKANKNYRSLCSIAPIIKKKMSVVLNDNQSYNVIEEIGKGSYAKIYLIQNKSQKDKKYALKVDRQATAWEYYITEIIHERLAVMSTEKMMQIDVMTSFVKIEQFMKFSDGCFSAMNYYKNGSLLDLINYHKGEGMLEFPYWFVIYLTLEMLNIIDYLHKCKILHADIKADNFLVDQLPDSINYFVANKTKCLVLIDFNRSIDLSILPSEAEFYAKAENKSLLCCEMKSNKNWTYQIDFYGILSSIHCIIFKQYMETFSEGDKHKMTKKMPRNYDKIFSDLFETYLNIPNCQELPNLEKDWIAKFVSLFKNELGNSFHKSVDYLKVLNKHYRMKN